MPARPLLYPTGIAVGFILLSFDSTGVSPYAALRIVFVTGAFVVLLTAVLSVALRHRHAGGLLALLVVLGASGMSRPVLTVTLAVASVLLVAVVILSRARPIRIRWPQISYVLTVLTGVLLLAVGIRSVQDGRLLSAAQDLYFEGPLRPTSVERVAVDAAHPDVYLILLDGYPRPDKLLAEFGIDNGAFIGGLEERGFAVAHASRSNYMETRLTLQSMFGGGHVPTTGIPIGIAESRAAINDAPALQPFVAAGYETVSIP